MMNSVRSKTMAASRTIALGGALVTTPAIADDITVGAIFDLTGGLNIYGIQQSRALHLAVDTINENGGLLGQKINLVRERLPVRARQIHPVYQYPDFA